MEAAAVAATKREVEHGREFQLTPRVRAGSFAAMKQVLSLLMAFVFLQTQTWALSGGPFGGSSSTASLTGTYAGVLVPQIAPVIGAATSVGLFSLTQPDSGFTTGTISVFVNGTAFTGTIAGIMDPKDGTFRGVIDAQSSFQVSIPIQTTQIVNGVAVTTTTIQNFNVGAQGSMDCVVSLDLERNAFATIASTPSRVEGTATLDIFFTVDPNTGTPNITQTTAFDVDGFKQSDT
jgi:hypothetical protein